MKLPVRKCPDCGMELDARAHNLKAHRATHGLKGTKPLKIPDLFELPPVEPGEVRGEIPAVLEREIFKLERGED